jgi:hypothetical protein
MEQKRIFSFLTSGFFGYSIYGFGFDGLFFSCNFGYLSQKHHKFKTIQL